MSNWRHQGKQVLQDGRHFADAAGELEAMMIVNALRALDDRSDTPTIGQNRQWDDVAARVAAKRHFVRQQNDEMACSCGARWPVGEDHP